VSNDEHDDQLLAAARAGDRDALEELLERHQGQIYRFGMKMCRDPDDARDVLQDTLLAMARGVRDFRGASSVSTWLYTIARSYCIKKRRKSKYAPAETVSLDADGSPEVMTLADPEAPPDEALAGKQVERALEQAIGRLDDGQREVLVLRDVEGLSAREVAEVLGISVEAVKSRLHRARLAVRAEVAPMLGIGIAAATPDCPDVLDLLSRHLEGEISAEVCAEMERHLDGCDRCRGSCDSLRKTLAMCQAQPAQVPGTVQQSVRAAIRGFLAENPFGGERL